jgi:dGTPase
VPRAAPFERNERRYSSSRPREQDKREEGQRDRDRILYTSAFRRLAGITQVVAPAEGQVFHNRLTHTLEVAQIGRRLAERLIKRHSKNFIRELGGLDPEVVEAAALAHDLGHPPFGHVAETTLRSLLDAQKIRDGFEGNAQSFRILTRLAARYLDEEAEGIAGLDLTRATLRAILKYPWLRGGGKDSDKWGVYDSDLTYLEWAKANYREDLNRSVEAELMDWADDVAYAVHDVEDFYRAGLIPLDRLSTDVDSEERERFLDSAFERLRKKDPKLRRRHLDDVFDEVVLLLPTTEPYQGGRQQRAALRSLTSNLINRYVDAIQLVHPSANAEGRLVRVRPGLRLEVDLLKQFTWHYVILSPSLSTQQQGQKQVIEQLFCMFARDANSKQYSMFPVGYQEMLQNIDKDDQDGAGRVRVVTDYIASMTEQQALKMHRRLTGASLGSVLDPAALQ